MQLKSFSKLNKPVVKNVLYRERIFDKLDQAREKKIIYVTGLPGSGKTTLVASYLSVKKIPCAWYHLDSADADLPTFFYYLRHIVREGNFTKSPALPSLTSEYLADIKTYTRKYFEKLYSMLPKGFALVFDNYQEINVNPFFHSIMNEALMMVPNHGTVILISRTEPPAIFSRLRANSIMGIVDNEFIKFTEDETERLIQLVSGKKPDSEVVAKIYNLTDGWAAGIVLMLEQNNLSLKYIDKSELKDYQFIFDYFSTEIFDMMEPAIQDFLLKTSFFPSMTIEMAKMMTNNNASERILNGLKTSHYFTMKHQNEIYKYHDLFREFLLRQAKTHFNEAKLKQIYKRAALILKENGKIEEAIILFQKADDWENVKAIIKESSQILISEGRNKILESWIKSLPKKELNQDPWLLYWLGQACAIFNPVEGRTYFKKAFKKFLTEKYDSDGQYTAWCGIIETFIYEYGNFKPIKRWLKIMEHIILKHRKFPSLDLEARVLSLLVYALIHYNPAHPKLASWVNRTQKLLKYVKNPEQRIYYLFSISNYHGWMGNITQRGILEEIKQASGDFTIKTRLLQKMQRAAYARLISSKEECFKYIQEGLTIAEDSGVHFLDHMFLAQAVYFFLGVNDTKRAAEYLQKMRPTVNRGNALNVIQYDTLSGWVDHLEGNTSLAIEKLNRSLDLSSKAHIPFAEGLCHLALTQVLYKEGDYKGAEAHYKRAFLIGKHIKSNSIIFVSYCIKAYWLFNEKQKFNLPEAENKGLRMLKKAMSLGKKYGMINVYFAWGHMMPMLCLKALQNHIEVEYVRNLIQKLELFPETPPYECEEWPWALKFYTLGSFRILKEGKELELSRKAQSKPIELLQFLIVNYERSMEPDLISNVLWEEAQGDYAHQALDTTIHRLRKMLGSHDAVISQGGRLMLNAKKCWVDVHAFEHILDRGKQLLSGDNLPQKHGDIKTLETHIFNLYRGDFFTQEVIPPWAMPFRERLHEKFIHFIELLGRYYEYIGDELHAIVVYNKGLEIDNQVELFYQRLMIIYKSLGRYAEALAVYKRCVDRLASALDIEPSEKTKELFQSIIKSKMES